MSRHFSIAASAALALVCAPAAATAQTHAQTHSQTAAATPSAQTTPGTAARPGSHADNPAANRKDALAALQDARATLARLTEASMSEDARTALAAVSTDFRALYTAYTGEAPTAVKSASQAAQGTKAPDDTHTMKTAAAEWEPSYAALSTSIDRIAGQAAAARVGAVGTSGTAAAGSGGASTGPVELTTPVRQDFEVLRQELQRFHRAAGARDSVTVK